MLLPPTQNYNLFQHQTSLEFKHCNQYRQRRLNTPSALQEKANFPLYPSLSKHKHKTYQQNNQNESTDTCQSERLNNVAEIRGTKGNKLKVQLCKNYMEKGYCPYKDKCRFAHGVEELRAKHTFCSSELYRTRKCKVFFEKQECKFGDRCNFMHDKRPLSQIVSAKLQSVRSALRCQFLEVRIACAESRISSRLLSILQIEQTSS